MIKNKERINISSARMGRFFGDIAEQIAISQIVNNHKQIIKEDSPIHIKH